MTTMLILRSLFALTFVATAGCSGAQQSPATPEAATAETGEAPETGEASETGESEQLKQVCAHYEAGWKSECEMEEEPCEGDPAVKCREYLTGRTAEDLQRIQKCLDAASEPAEVTQCVEDYDPNSDDADE
jgi:hypothetical protein